MNHEMKLLTKKLMAIFLSLALIVGLCPAVVMADPEGDEKEFSAVLLDYEGTYYNGFNDEVAVATGTFIELNYGEESNYIDVNKAVAKVDGSNFTEEIFLNGSVMANAVVEYEDGNVCIKVVVPSGNGSEELIYKELLYTPEYVDLSEMPTITLNQEVDVTNGFEKSCEQYYRVDVTTVPATYKAFTIISNDEDDTYMTLYNDTRRRLKRNDTTDEEDENIDSSITFTMPQEEVRVIGVRGYQYQFLSATKLKLVTGAKSITSFTSDNIDSLNVFYEGFNDYLLYATGTRIQAELDNGDVRNWQAEDYYYEFDEETGESYIDFEDVEARVFRASDGIYVEYGLTFDQDSKQFTKFYEPVIKPVSDIAQIEEGTTNFETLPWAGAYSYYRITAQENEGWTLTFAGNDETFKHLSVRVFDENGTYLEGNYQKKDAQTGIFDDIEMYVTVPAGETRVIAVYDNADQSQPFTMTATKDILPDETTSEDESNDIDEPTDIDESTEVVSNTGKDTTIDEQSTTSDENQSTDSEEGQTTPEGQQEETTKYNPGFNPSNLNYTEISSNGNDDKKIEYAIQDGSTLEGIQPWYGDDGNTFMLQFADPNAEGTKADVKVNGAEPGDGVITETAQGLVKVNPNKLPDDSYTVVEVTLESGKTATFVIKKGNPVEDIDQGETGKEETTIEMDTVTEENTTDVTTADNTTQDVTTQAPTDTTTASTETTQALTTQAATTAKADVTTVATPKATKIKVGKAKIKKCVKKNKSAKKVKVTLKKLVKNATGYEVRAYKNKKNAKKNKKAIAKKVLKKNKKALTLKAKKLKGKAKVFIRVRAFRVVNGKKYNGKWSAVKKCKKK